MFRVDNERAMSWLEAAVRTRLNDVLARASHRERGEGIASQAVIIGVTAVIGTAIVSAFMTGLGQVFTRELAKIGGIVP